MLAKQSSVTPAFSPPACSPQMAPQHAQPRTEPGRPRSGPVLARLGAKDHVRRISNFGNAALSILTSASQSDMLCNSSRCKIHKPRKGFKVLQDFVTQIKVMQNSSAPRVPQVPVTAVPCRTKGCNFRSPMSGLRSSTGAGYKEAVAN